MRRRILGCVALSGVCALVGLGLTSASANRQAVPPAGSLTVGLGATAINAQYYVAQAEGFFAKSGVTVTLVEGPGSQTANLVASGQIDIGFFGIATPMLMANQGKETTVIYTQAAGGSGGVLFGNKNITSISQLAGQRIGTLAPGGSSYGFAQYYSKKYNLNAQVVPYGDNATLEALLVSGQIAGIVDAFDFHTASVANGNANVLVDTRTQAGRTKASIPSYPEGALFGLTANIISKQKAVIAFVWALEQARKWLNTHTDAQVAAALAKASAFFKAQPPAIVESSVKSTRGYIAPTAGRITAASWPDSLQFYGQWAVPGFDVSNPIFRYSQRINMGYLNAALRRGVNYQLLPHCKKGQKSTAKKPCRTN